MNEVYKKIYDSVVNNDHEYDYVIKIISKEKNISEKSLEEGFNNYIKNQSKRKQKKYLQKNKSHNKKNQAKYYFDIFINQKKNIRQNPKLVKKYSLIYYNNYASEEEKKLFDNLATNVSNQKLLLEAIDLFETIIPMSDYEQVNKEYESKKISINTLNKMKKEYLSYIKQDINISESTKKTIEKIITISIQDYRKYLEEERRKKQEEKNKNKKELYESSLANAETFITLIISNKIENINDFCKKYNVTKEQIKLYVEVVKELNNELYEEYKNKMKEEKVKKYQDIIKKIKYICNRLKEDIEKNTPEDDRFNIYNYYQITKIPLNKIILIAKNECTQDEYILLKKFVNDNNYQRPINKKEILSSSNDYELSKKAINKMIEENMPMYENIYKIVKKEMENNNVSKQSKRVL